MAGHSKWANIKRRKGAADAARGKLFTKLIREITVAARVGGGDLAANARLRAAVDKARGQSMPRDNIERAIAKGAGDLAGEAWEEVQFEGYGPGGVAIMVHCLTDNRNRTTAEVRYAFSKHGGNLGTTGCVGYLFQRRGLITLPADGVDEDELMMVALEAGADDVSEDDGTYDVVCEVPVFEACLAALRDAGFALPEGGELTWVPDNQVEVAGAQAQQVVRLLEVLEDLDDVQQVYSNADLDLETAEA